MENTDIDDETVGMLSRIAYGYFLAELRYNL